MSTSSSHSRIGYIRTVSNHYQDSKYAIELLDICMGKWSTKRLDARKHRFLITAARISDAHILDEIIARIPIEVPVHHATATSMHPDRCVENKHGVERFNFELHISSTHATTKTGRKILERCKGEGIETQISGATDNECDEILLYKSHYLIDFLTPPLFLDCFPQTKHSNRHLQWLDVIMSGSVQDNALTNPDYEKYDVSQERLRHRGYLGRLSMYRYSGCSQVKKPWRCYSCGQKCKRGRCNRVPSPENRAFVEREAHRRKWEEQWRFKPTWENKHWNDITAEERCIMFAMKSEKERIWKSIDTFTGD